MKKTVLALSCMLLFGCGFHLRGATEIPTWLAPIAISNHNVSQSMQRALSHMLSAYQLDNPSGLKSKNHIVLEDDKLDKEIISVAASTAPRQYQLIYTLHYSLNGSKLKTKRHTIQVTRQITINNDRILGSDAEEAVTIADMHREASGLLLNQLSHLSR